MQMQIVGLVKGRVYKFLSQFYSFFYKIKLKINKILIQS
jgi:hypothetical protein